MEHKVCQYYILDSFRDERNYVSLLEEDRKSGSEERKVIIRGGERQRQRQAHTQTQTHTHAHSHRHTHKHRHSHTDT